MIGPVQLEATVHFCIAGRLAKATVGLSPGKEVTEQDLLVAIGQAVESVRDQFDGHDIELMDAKTFFNAVLVPEKTGHRGNFALPRSFDYDVDSVVKRASEALAASAKEES